jgi:hypothetical protein
MRSSEHECTAIDPIFGKVPSTVATIWSGHPTTKAHYVDSAGSNPGLLLPDPNPIPAQPYSARDARVAKRDNILPNCPPVSAEHRDVESPGESESPRIGENADR